MSYRLTILNDDDEVLDVINLDGYDLTRPSHRGAVGDAVATGMGSRHVAECASRQGPEEGE